MLWTSIFEQVRGAPCGEDVKGGEQHDKEEKKHIENSSDLFSEFERKESENNKEKVKKF